MIAPASALVLALAGLATAAPAPTPRATTTEDIDTTILNYALTLEHLENNFYSTALSTFSESDFASAGYPGWVRRRISQIASHEASHVAFLSTALGDAATAPCTYKFPYTDVKSFLGLATAIENVGVSAYLGAASKITNPDYLTAAGAILTTEARHQAWLASAVTKGAAWSSAYDTPLGFSQVYSIAGGFITGCPSTNPTLPVKAFPAASIKETGYKAGDTVTLDFKTTGATEYLIVYEGLASSAGLINADATTMLPTGLQGTAYAVIATTSDPKMVTDSNTVAGPIILSFGLTSYETSTPFTGM